jgi:hypothetical protein
MRRGLLLTTALLLTACGGGDDAKAAYVEDASAICDKAAEQSKALKRPTSAVEFSPYADSIVRIAKQAQQALAELEPPADGREDLETKVLDPFAAVVEEGEAFAEKVRAAGQDQAKLLPLLSQVPDAGDVDLEYLRSYGLDTCADVISQGQQ